MAVLKKSTSISKKHIRKNIWRRKGYWAVLKAFLLGNLFLQGSQKVLLCNKQKQISNRRLK